MTEFALPLERMTVEEKLEVMEDIWVDLLRSRETLPSPAWHADVLKARERRVREGVSVFGDWEDAKRRIRERTR